MSGAEQQTSEETLEEKLDLDEIVKEISKLRKKKGHTSEEQTRIHESFEELCLALYQRGQLNDDAVRKYMEKAGFPKPSSIIGQRLRKINVRSIKDLEKRFEEKYGVLHYAVDEELLNYVIKNSAPSAEKVTLLLNAFRGGVITRDAVQEKLDCTKGVSGIMFGLYRNYLALVKVKRENKTLDVNGHEITPYMRYFLSYTENYFLDHLAAGKNTFDSLAEVTMGNTKGAKQANVTRAINGIEKTLGIKTGINVAPPKDLPKINLKMRESDIVRHLKEKDLELTIENIQEVYEQLGFVRSQSRAERFIDLYGSSFEELTEKGNPYYIQYYIDLQQKKPKEERQGPRKHLKISDVCAVLKKEGKLDRKNIINMYRDAGYKHPERSIVSPLREFDNDLEKAAEQGTAENVPRWLYDPDVRPPGAQEPEVITPRYTGNVTVSAETLDTLVRANEEKDKVIATQAEATDHLLNATEHMSRYIALQKQLENTDYSPVEKAKQDAKKALEEQAEKQ